MPDDLYVDPKGDVHLLWSERAIDERLRPKFFPGAKQSYALNLALVRRGQVVRRQMLEESTEDKPGIVGSEARFQVTPDHRLFVVYYATGVDLTGNQVSENRIAEVLKDGTLTPPKRLPLKKPFTGFFTATIRAGSPPSRTLEMLGEQAGTPLTISYAAVRLF